MTLFKELAKNLIDENPPTRPEDSPDEVEELEARAVLPDVDKSPSSEVVYCAHHSNRGNGCKPGTCPRFLWIGDYEEEVGGCYLKRKKRPARLVNRAMRGGPSV